MTLYTALIFIQILAAIALIFLMSASSLVGTRLKVCYSVAFALLAVVSLAEWLNIALNGAPESLRILHYIVKILEFSAVPGLIAMGIIAFETFKYTKQLVVVIILQALFQCMMAPFGQIFYMDATNTYVRGPLYFIYVAFYTIEAVILVLQFRSLGKKFQGHNPLPIIMGGAFCTFGVSLQLINSSNRTAFLTAELALVMSYIYINNLLLQTDKLTGLLNRWSYEKRLESINYPTAILIFDIDSFKTINDSFGHRVGDSCLKIVASVIIKIFAKEGKCYRIGGDEFCVIFKKNSKYATALSEERMNAILDRFNQEIADIRKIDPRFTGVSVGYGFAEKDIPIQFAVEQADKMMYELKNKKK